ncbi:lipopolysaccharide export system protein lptA [Candidatus Photodesmus katoptron]|uniref:Lipopolysaccharide export system protein LptA n=1 Tax=Candidatus Photodesmus katoptron Akat1 TaxID=1236703 RepID=S3DZ95_9GAMM|nr:lipopolysaccharide transport periplasmic protein LptA [Candidatus Photodesmus katoptron]EPE37241.1 lipopolysaccharide transport periplasmic protein LptA [Candidatus Photodesmus katoptron Akat1]KEY90102.1 lipopolysaccharide export system protein lptA [Candidatus Photodesmus katoptron]
MNFLYLSLFSLFLLLIPNGTTSALLTNQNHPVYINSNSQRLDMQSNEVTFLGDVKLKQGDLSIHAEKIIIILDKDNSTIQKIEGYGNLATFSQLRDDGKILYGEAEELYYNIIDNQLIISERAMLSQENSIIRGNKIYYNIANQKLVVNGNINNRVSTTLQPKIIKK